MSLLEKKVLFVDLSNKNWKIKKIHNKEIIGVVDFAVDMHLNQYESWKYDPLHPKNVVVIGIGSLSSSIIPGTHRLIFVARSPLLKGFFISTMGGAGYIFHRLNI